MIRNYLKAGINRTLDDTHCREISRATIEGYGEGQWPEIMPALKEWQAAGYLTILRDPREVGMEDVCVIMKQYIESSVDLVRGGKARSGGSGAALVPSQSETSERIEHASCAITCCRRCKSFCDPQTPRRFVPVSSSSRGLRRV